jgi:hypothetical protein
MNYNLLISPFILLSIYESFYSLFIYTLRSFLLFIFILRLFLLSLGILLFNSFKVYNPSLSDILLKVKR